MTAVTRTKRNEITQEATVWFNANADKNAAAKIESASKKKLLKLTGELDEPITVKIDDKNSLTIGITEKENETVDIRKLYAMYPDKFWEVVSATKTAVIEHLGERAFVECSKTDVSQDFQIKKVA